MIRFVTRSAGVSPAPAERARSVSERQAAPAASSAVPIVAARLRVALTFALLAVFAAACSSHGHTHDENGEHPDEVDEHRDQWRPREAQSDFLDIGQQAGIEWLSFVPDDQHEYPEYFEGLDRDQKNRLRLAPKGSDEQVLIQFDLPLGSKLWPVDWYGTELMAVDLPNVEGFSVAIAALPPGGISGSNQVSSLVDLQAARGIYLDGAGLSHEVHELDGTEFYTQGLSGLQDSLTALYGIRRIYGKHATVTLYVEARRTDGQAKLSSAHEAGLETILSGISIKREIGLEGSPKHKCTSTLEEQLAGTLRFADGTLKLPVSDGQLVRKIGGDSTIQIDGEGAEPWILIRRLKESETEGDLRAQLRRDTTFNRRLKVPSGKFSEGYVPEGATLPIVCFDYDDSAAENNLLGILKAGNELLTFEVVTRGVLDGDKRREAKASALKLLANTTADPATEAPEFEPLVGWNAGTMGTGE